MSWNPTTLLTAALLVAGGCRFSDPLDDPRYDLDDESIVDRQGLRTNRLSWLGQFIHPALDANVENPLTKDERDIYLALWHELQVTSGIVVEETTLGIYEELAGFEFCLACIECALSAASDSHDANTERCRIRHFKQFAKESRAMLKREHGGIRSDTVAGYLAAGAHVSRLSDLGPQKGVVYATFATDEQVKTLGSWSFSPVGLSADGRQALLHGLWYRDPLAITSEYFVLEHGWFGWKVRSRILLWQS